MAQDYERLLGTVLDNLNDGVCLYNAAGDFLFVNAPVIASRGVSRDQYRRQNVHDLITDGNIDICVFDIVMKEKNIVQRLQRCYPVGKPSLLRLVTGIPIFDEQGAIKNVITVIQDVGEIEKNYRRLLKEKSVIDGTGLFLQQRKEDIIATSPQMKNLLEVAGNVAKLDATVLICGESGTGKEVLMNYIHRHSDRSKKPLIEVNCAAFPENLLEAELFGYEKGSFTGALHTGKMGFAEAADGGTLFLDEINSLPLSFQGKLLKMIEEKSITRIGSVKKKKVDFRLVTATNVDLMEMVNKGQFRLDLYYRLNVIPLTIPPLRERRADILPLCKYFTQYFCEKYGMNKVFSKSVLRKISSYSWPGNVRELRNFVERMLVMTPMDVLVINRIPAGMLGRTVKETKKAPKQRMGRVQLDREKVIRALEVCGGHREKTAEYLGISRRTLQYKLREFGLLSEENS